jgi:hypothetical protein
MILLRAAGLTFALLLAGCAGSHPSAARSVVQEEFVGTTLCDARSRAFLGGLATNAPCHCITWRLGLSRDRKTSQPTTYTLTAAYGVPGKNDFNQLEEGPTVKLVGKWEITRGHKANPEAPVYRLHGDNAEKTISLGRVSQHLFHFLEADQSLRVGDAGWSYTLNRKGLGQEK